MLESVDKTVWWNCFCLYYLFIYFVEKTVLSLSENDIEKQLLHKCSRLVMKCEENWLKSANDVMFWSVAHWSEVHRLSKLLFCLQFIYVLINSLVVPSWVHDEKQSRKVRNSVDFESDWEFRSTLGVWTSSEVFDLRVVACLNRRAKSEPNCRWICWIDVWFVCMCGFMCLYSVI